MPPPLRRAGSWSLALAKAPETTPALAIPRGRSTLLAVPPGRSTLLATFRALWAAVSGQRGREARAEVVISRTMISSESKGLPPLSKIESPRRPPRKSSLRRRRAPPRASPARAAAGWRNGGGASRTIHMMWPPSPRNLQAHIAASAPTAVRPLADKRADADVPPRAENVRPPGRNLLRPATARPLFRKSSGRRRCGLLPVTGRPLSMFAWPRC
ncbi:hypothetical protein M885DRAFT_345846 [Pelagophyceae sp. CCMP2097]|nr:hypothetical protein M885DRAFT_345846 [Pelagophyceae sp. CCMP2097]